MVKNIIIFFQFQWSLIFFMPGCLVKKRNNFLFKYSFILVPDRTKDKVRKVFWEYFKLWPKSLNSATAKTNFSTLFADRYIKTFSKILFNPNLLRRFVGITNQILDFSGIGKALFVHFLWFHSKSIFKKMFFLQGPSCHSVPGAGQHLQHRHHQHSKSRRCFLQSTLKQENSEVAWIHFLFALLCVFFCNFSQVREAPKRNFL